MSYNKNILIYLKRKLMDCSSTTSNSVNHIMFDIVMYTSIDVEAASKKIADQDTDIFTTIFKDSLINGHFIKSLPCSFIINSNVYKEVTDSLENKNIFGFQVSLIYADFASEDSKSAFSILPVEINKYICKLINQLPYLTYPDFIRKFQKNTDPVSPMPFQFDLNNVILQNSTESNPDVIPNKGLQIAIENSKELQKIPVKKKKKFKGCTIL